MAEKSGSDEKERMMFFSFLLLPRKFVREPGGGGEFLFFFSTVPYIHSHDEISHNGRHVRSQLLLLFFLPQMLYIAGFCDAATECAQWEPKFPLVFFFWQCDSAAYTNFSWICEIETKATSINSYYKDDNNNSLLVGPSSSRARTILIWNPESF